MRRPIKAIRKYKLNRRGQRGGQRKHKQVKVELRSLITININDDTTQVEMNNSSNIKLTLANMQSIRNKDLLLYDYLQSNNSDICILTETWLHNCVNDDIWLEMTDLNKNGFKMGVSNRTNPLGCGLAIITKSQLGQHKIDEGEKQSFQYEIWKITTKHDTMTVVAIYHPPYSMRHPITNTIFIDEITEWLPLVLTNHNNIITAGNFNLNVNDESDTGASIFTHTMEAMGLQQHVTYPTHKSDNILDLVFTKLMTQIHIKDLSCGSFLSGHCTVDFTTTIPQDKPKQIQ